MLITRQLSVVRYPRAARCGALGIFINGLGYWAWVHALNKVIPQREVDDNGNTLQAFGLLIGKSLLDSCLWGTTANSMGIVGKPECVSMYAHAHMPAVCEDARVLV